MVVMVTVMVMMMMMGMVVLVVMMMMMLMMMLMMGMGMVVVVMMTMISSQGGGLQFCLSFAKTWIPVGGAGLSATMLSRSAPLCLLALSTALSLQSVHSRKSPYTVMAKAWRTFSSTTWRPEPFRKEHSILTKQRRSKIVDNAGDVLTRVKHSRECNTFNHVVLTADTTMINQLWGLNHENLRPCPHVPGNFRKRIFFLCIKKICAAFSNRIQPSTCIKRIPKLPVTCNGSRIRRNRSPFS